MTATSTAVTAPRIDTVFDLDALLTDEERDWRDRARRFAQERIAPVIEQDFEDKHFRRELVREAGELGFLGMHLTGYGCAGAGAVSYGLVCLELEAADSGWRTFVSVQGSLAMSAIHKYGSEELRERYLTPALRGDLVAAFALTEPDAGSDVAGITTRAERRGDRWVLRGTKTWVTNAPVADMLTVAAKTSGERGIKNIALFLLANGARPTIFSAAMLGQLDVVKAFITAMPGIQRTSGPHGFTLLHCVKQGGEAARPVYDYLIAQGVPEVFQRPLPYIWPEGTKPTEPARS